jgi:hypothetical protein
LLVRQSTTSAKGIEGKCDAICRFLLFIRVLLSYPKRSNDANGNRFRTYPNQ